MKEIIHMTKTDKKTTYCGLAASTNLASDKSFYYTPSGVEYAETRTTSDGNISQQMPPLSDYAKFSAFISQLGICPDCGRALCEERVAKYDNKGA